METPISKEEAEQIGRTLIAIPYAPIVADIFGRNVVDIFRLAYEHHLHLEPAIPPEPRARTAPLSPEQYARALAALKENANARQAALRAGISAASALNIAHREGIDLLWHELHAVSADEYKAVLAVLPEVHYAAAAARLLGLSSPTVAKVGREAGLYLPAEGEVYLTGRRREQVLADLRESRNVRAVAKKHRLSDMNVRALAVEDGMKWMDRAPPISQGRGRALSAVLEVIPNAGRAARLARVAYYVARSLAHRKNIDLQGNKIPDEERSSIIRDLEQTPNARQVAAKRGKSPTAVAGIARDAKIALSSKGGNRKGNRCALRISEEKQAAIKAELFTNPSPGSVAKKLGIARRSVIRVGERSHILPPETSAASPPNDESILALLQETRNGRQTARILGVSEYRVRKVGKKNHIDCTGKGGNRQATGQPGLSPEQKSRMFECWLDCENSAETSRRTGIHVSTVRTLVRAEKAKGNFPGNIRPSCSRPKASADRPPAQPS